MTLSAPLGNFAVSLNLGRYHCILEDCFHTSEDRTAFLESGEEDLRPPLLFSCLLSIPEHLIPDPDPEDAMCPRVQINPDLTRMFPRNYCCETRSYGEIPSGYAVVDVYQHLIFLCHTHLLPSFILVYSHAKKKLSNKNEREPLLSERGGSSDNC